MTPSAFDYVVVGSGPGGGTVAARLAEAGATVLVLEAGDDIRRQPGTHEYEAPLLSHLAYEDPAFNWHFFVRHYASDELQQRDRSP
jgi:choline dehydrogenase-like flavoprotein